MGGGAAIGRHSKIDGRIIGDDQRFDDEGIGPGWAWDYLQFGYAAPVGALQFNENLATLTIRPAVAGQPAQVMLPPGAGFTLINRVATVASGATPSIDTAAGSTSRCSRSPARSARTPPRSSAQWRSSTRRSFSLNRQGWIDRSRDCGHRQCGRPGRRRRELSQSTAERRTIVTTSSPPLRRIATVLMISGDLYAETLSRRSAERGTASDFRRRAERSPRHAHVLGHTYRCAADADGSGLSRYNYPRPRP